MEQDRHARPKRHFLPTFKSSPTSFRKRSTPPSSPSTPKTSSTRSNSARNSAAPALLSKKVPTRTCPSIYIAEAPKDRDNFFYWEGQPPPKYDNVMTWWLEPAEGGAVIKYGTGNLGRNGVEWQAPFAIGKWHQLAMHIHWSEDKDKGQHRLWLDGALVLDKHLKTKGPEAEYFCQPGIHRSPHRDSVDTIYFDNFILADSLEDILKPAK